MAQSSKGIYQRGEFWLDRQTSSDEKTVSPNLFIFWYDKSTRRTKRTTTSETDEERGKLKLDIHYLEKSKGARCCPTCGSSLESSSSIALADAIMSYQLLVGQHKVSAKAITHRLDHIADYLETFTGPDVLCDEVDQIWVDGFRRWFTQKPIQLPNDKTRTRSPSTVEASVAQLSAVINNAFDRGDAKRVARFKKVQGKYTNRTPKFRLSFDQLRQMFEYASDPTLQHYRENLRMYLVLSVVTMGRPDAVLDFSLDQARGQWQPMSRVLNLNPDGRIQTKKYRATVKIPESLAHLFDNASGLFVGADITTAWRAMIKKLNMETRGESGIKLIRRSMSKLLRDRGAPGDQVSMFLGHHEIDSVTAIYAPFEPNYLSEALLVIDAMVSEISLTVPGAFAPRLHPDEIRELRVAPIKTA
jgi:integrase